MDATPTPPAKKPSKLLARYYGTMFFLLILAFVGVAAFVLKPMLDMVKETNAQVTADLATLQGDRTYLESLDTSISAAQNIPSTVLGQVDRALPDQTQIPELLVLFGDIGDREGVKVNSVSFSEESASARQQRATSTISDVTVNLAVTAPNYFQIKRFLSDIEASLRILDVTGINVSTRGGGEASYAILLKTYVYSPPKSARQPTPPQR